MTGDHKNFTVYGMETRENKPIVFKSIPATVSHAYNVPDVRGRGRPEENPSSNIVKILLFKKNLLCLLLLFIFNGSSL